MDEILLLLADGRCKIACRRVLSFTIVSYRVPFVLICIYGYGTGRNWRQD